MRHLTAGSKSVLIGDSVAELLIRYATLLNQQHTADSVDLRGYDTTGAATIVTLLLNDGLTLVAEQVATDLPDPDDAAAERYLQAQVESTIRRQEPAYDDVAGTDIWNRE